MIERCWRPSTPSSTRMTSTTSAGARWSTAVGEEGALDLLLLCGWYHAISFVARVTRLPGEEGAARFADYDSPGPPS